jgi:hypothetical protein
MKHKKRKDHGFLAEIPTQTSGEPETVEAPVFRGISTCSLAGSENWNYFARRYRTF